MVAGLAMKDRETPAYGRCTVSAALGCVAYYILYFFKSFAYDGLLMGGLTASVAAQLTKFRNSKYVENAFYGLRPASSGLIGAACAGVVLQVLLRVTSTAVPDSLFMRFSWDGTVSWMGLALAAVLLVLTNWVKLTKKWHPIVFIGLSAAVGVVFRFGGV